MRFSTSILAILFACGLLTSSCSSSNMHGRHDGRPDGRPDRGHDGRGPRRH